LELMRDKRALIVGGIVALLGLTYWMFQDTSQTLPGEEISDMGREHIQDISGIQYNSNPPTSGNHFPIWAKKGIYDRVLSDGYLIHSLEHGYVVISYNCANSSNPVQAIATSSAAPTEKQATPSAEASPSGMPLTKMIAPTGGLTQTYSPDNPPAPEVSLPEAFRSVQCKNLVDQLSTLTKVADRVIIVPRPNMDYRVALTSWGRILNLKDLKTEDTLTDTEYKQAEVFAKRLQNRGPEKTME
jgi:hypothetical protein